MKRIVYSPEAIWKIKQIYRSVSAEYGEKKGREVRDAITGRIQSLKELDRQGASMHELYGIMPDYRKLYVAHNYIFYLVDDEIIRIINIYHEREDFMWKLFGIREVEQGGNYQDKN